MTSKQGTGKDKKKNAKDMLRALRESEEIRQMQGK